MRMPLMYLSLFLLMGLSGACSHRPTYGRPMARDTVPTTKEPPNPKATPTNPERPPDPGRSG
jgi:hypothetical protein